MVSTRTTKGSSPRSQSPSQSQSQEDAASPTPSQSQPSPSSSRGSKRKRARPSQKSRSQTPSTPESPKSDSSAREKMRKTKIEEAETEEGASENKRRKTSESPVDEMTDVRSAELSPGSKGRKRVHDEIASSSKETKISNQESDNRPPSRAANGEPLEKKLRETPSPPRETTGKSIEKEEVKEGSNDTEKDPEPKKPEVKLSSGFSNTSTVSPFGTFGSNASSQKTAEGNAKSGFENSKFGSFAKVESPFGVSPTPLAASPFGGPPTGSANIFAQMSAAPKSSPFAGPPTGKDNVFAQMSGKTEASGFGSLRPQGFGSLAAPFGGGSVFGPAVGKPLPKPQPLEAIKSAGKPTKEENGDSDSGDDEDDLTSEAADNGENDGSKSNVPAKLAIKSGEEGYQAVFQARGKLFELASGGWKERGVGTIKVLTPDEEYEFDAYGENVASKKPSAGRIVMRQEGVGRLILNTNIFKNMLVKSGKSVSDNTIHFMAVNSIVFAETGDDKSKDEKQKENEKDTEAEETDDKSSTRADEHKQALRNYVLRVKGSELANGFKEHVEASYPA
ncbi:hypothetical protein ABW19_dt0201966 [Dactylella cylindrospora]|nr:hypothetical protein ABW19_dt0201966 [Dactylella cylindrospora]